MQAMKQWRRTVRRYLRRVPDDPESLLIRAQTEMAEAQARHRQRVVDAITAKNNLQQQVNDMQARVDNFRNKATLADERGDEENARQLRREGEEREKLLVLLQEQMARADAVTEHLKQTFHLQDEVRRQKIAETLTLKVQYQMSVLQKKMADALIGEADDTPAQRRAREKSRQIVLLDAQKREKEFAALVQTVEAETTSLRVQINRARFPNASAEQVLRRELENEETTLTLLRDAHDRARDVRERAERWASAKPKNSAVDGDASTNETPPEKENPWMWKRLWNYCKSLMSGGGNNVENPELLLAQAQAEMREQQARNRARAVQAVTAKNNLREQVKDMKQRIDSLNAKANEADADGDHEAAEKLRRQIDAYQKSLTAMEESLIQAEAITEQVKKAIEYEEETIRRKTEEALALKAQWKNSQIHSQMQKDLRDLMGGAGKSTNRASDPILRCLLATYGFILLLLLLVLLIVRAGR